MAIRRKIKNESDNCMMTIRMLFRRALQDRAARVTLSRHATTTVSPYLCAMDELEVVVQVFGTVLVRQNMHSTTMILKFRMRKKQRKKNKERRNFHKSEKQTVRSSDVSNLCNCLSANRLLLFSFI